MNHDEALDRITGYLLMQPIGEQELSHAKWHIASCRACIDELDGIMSVLSGNSVRLKEQWAELVECAEASQMLGDFTLGILDPDGREYQQIQRHLERCPRCREEKERLEGMMNIVGEAFQSEVPGSPFSPAPTATPAKPPLWAMVNERYKQLGSKIKLAVQAHRVAFLPAPELPELKFAVVPSGKTAMRATRSGHPSPPPTEEPSGTGEGATARAVFQVLEIPDKAMNLLVRLKISDTDSIEINVCRLDDARGFDNTTVSIIDRTSGDILDSKKTNREGAAICRGIPFLSGNEYTIRLLHNDMRWEIYLS